MSSVIGCIARSRRGLIRKIASVCIKLVPCHDSGLLFSNFFSGGASPAERPVALSTYPVIASLAAEAGRLLPSTGSFLAPSSLRELLGAHRLQALPVEEEKRRAKKSATKSQLDGETAKTNNQVSGTQIHLKGYAWRHKQLLSMIRIFRCKGVATKKLIEAFVALLRHFGTAYMFHDTRVEPTVFRQD